MTRPARLASSGELLGGSPPADTAAAGHESVLLKELVHGLAPVAAGVYLDATFGSGGHSRAILKAANQTQVIAIDQDPAVHSYAEQLTREYPRRFCFASARFANLDKIAAKYSDAPVNGVAMDLGVSSMQLDDPLRGFSFRYDTPINHATMRMDSTNTSNLSAQSDNSKTLASLLASIDAASLEEILRYEGEEPKARAIARAITVLRDGQGMHSTGDILRAADTVPGAHGPARNKRLARLFQALRRHLNDEAQELEQALVASARALAIGGRCVIISFHSLEDRVVKQAFANNAKVSPFVPCGKPVQPSPDECTRNPRARSARLRVAERTAMPAPTEPWWRGKEWRGKEWKAQGQKAQGQKAQGQKAQRREAQGWRQAA